MRVRQRPAALAGRMLVWHGLRLVWSLAGHGLPGRRRRRRPRARRARHDDTMTRCVRSSAARRPPCCCCSVRAREDVARHTYRPPRRLGVRPAAGACPRSLAGAPGDVLVGGRRFGRTRAEGPGRCAARALGRWPCCPADRTTSMSMYGVYMDGMYSTYTWTGTGWDHSAVCSSVLVGGPGVDAPVAGPWLGRPAACRPFLAPGRLHTQPTCL